jgi:hypothetical protein
MPWGATLMAMVALVVTNVHNHEKNCYSQLARCGYPSISTTGVPKGTQLQPSGSITIDKDGTVVAGKEIEGKVVVEASDVTIKESVITATESGSGSSAIELKEGADDFHLENSEVRGKSKKNGLESAVFNHYGNPGASAVNTYFHLCADCWEGSGRFNHDLMVVDASYPGSHDEDIYVCGDTVRVENSTVINRHDQTAAVFGDTSGCGGNRFIVVNNLLAGGGYVLYPQANSDSSTGYMKVTGNRFARCGGKREFQAGPGGTVCAGGGNSGGVFPQGGYYGVAAYFYLDGANTWSGNYWDDNLKPVCVSRRC